MVKTLQVLSIKLLSIEVKYVMKGGSDMDTHKRLRQLLQEHKWSEYRLSKKCGLSESTLANIFKRNTLPSISTLESICAGFGITLSQFFAEGDMVEMTPEIKELFDLWAPLTVEQKNAVMQIIRAFNSDK